MAPIFDQIQGVASALLTDLCCRLAASDHPVCRCGFGFGEPPPVSNCCNCAGGSGEAWVRVGAVVPSSTFPIPDTGRTVCEYGTFAVTFTLGIYRCAPTLDDRANPPTTAQNAAALVIQLQDRALLAQVARCVMRADDRGWLMGAWAPIDPSGGCMGSALTLTVAVDDCLDCPVCPEPEEP